MKIDTSVIKNGMSAAGTFIKETRTEAKKVVWPDRKYVTAATVIIIIILVVTSVFVTFVDYAFGKLFETLMRAR